jgi:putative methionine-R-sulfoxide reductase with GAF domain
VTTPDAPDGVALDAIRECLEGTIPAMMATCAPDGTPNVTYLSQIQYVDPEHVGLSFQFFNKTRANVLGNPCAEVLVVHPFTGAIYRIDLRYLRTETAGPLFETMKAKLAGIASAHGMAHVFRLRGADVYRVESIERVTRGDASMPAPPRCARHLGGLRRASLRIAAAADLDALLDETLAALQDAFGFDHSAILLLDRRADRLFTVASRGYPSSGAGSELPMGAGVIGTAARERTPIRINHVTAEYSYLRAVGESIERAGEIDRLETLIAPPGLRHAHSQLAVPIVTAGALLGVLAVESPEDMRFGYDDEDALVAIASQIGAALPLLQSQQAREAEAEAEDAASGRDGTGPGEAIRPAAPRASAGAPPIPLRHYPHDDSVFLGEEYLIKGVAGAVLWLMARDHAEHGRTLFTNRELRLDPRLRLPDIGDNLEARLVLLQRRLADRAACIRLEKAGRGRLRLQVHRPLRLVEIG